MLTELPRPPQDFRQARRVIYDPTATKAEMLAACDVLDGSGDWTDQEIARHLRVALKHAPDPVAQFTVRTKYVLVFAVALAAGIIIGETATRLIQQAAISAAGGL